MTKVLYTEEQILKRVGEIAREVEKDFADQKSLCCRLTRRFLCLYGRFDSES